MKVKKILFLLCALIIGFQVNAQVLKRNNKTKPRIEIVGTERLDQQAAELMAKSITPAKFDLEELAVAKIDNFEKLIIMEDLMFPADELYQSNWDTIRVNPFAKTTIDFPDKYTINCSSFIIPIDSELKITSKYGPRRRNMHRGIDLKVKIGDTIRVSFDGKVRIKSYERYGYGYYLVIRHPNGLETVYGHLSKFLVKENQIVRAGEPIALGGNTGRSTGSHLHFETRFLGKDINPEEIIDFTSGTPHKDEYVFHNIKINGKKSNIYATSADAVAVHNVKKGETLSLIAKKYGTTVTELCTLNGISKTSTLSIGQPIRIRSKQVTVEASPGAIEKVASDKKESDQKTQITQKSNTTDKKIEVAVEEVMTDANGHIYHSIQKGDSLYSIAKKYNTTIEKLCELNSLNDNIILKVGQKLRCS